MAIKPKIIDMPALGSSCVGEAPFALLAASAAARLAHQHAPQLEAAITSHRARFHLLDYLFENHRTIVVAMQIGMKQTEMHRLIGEQFQPQAPVSYQQFCTALARFRRLLGIPSARQRLKNTAAEVRSLLVAEGLLTGLSAPQTDAVKQSPANFFFIIGGPTFSTPAAPPATSPQADIRPAHLPALPPVAAELSLVATPPPRTENESIGSAVTHATDPVVASAADSRPPSAPPIPVAPKLGSVVLTGRTGEFIRSLTAPGVGPANTSTYDEAAQARMRQREDRLLAELAAKGFEPTSSRPKPG